MSENNTEQLNVEEPETAAAEAAVNTEEVPTEAPVTEETADIAETAADEAVQDSEEADDTAEEPNPEDTADEQTEEAAPAEETEVKPDKKRVLQIPVIISACIVAAALLCYLVFTAFFLKEPEGVTWSTELDGATYYFEFKDDGSFNTYVGTVEIAGSYTKEKGEDGDTLTVDTNAANFYSGASATYEITGSRLLGNQVMNYSYGEGYDFTVTQSSRKEMKPELPENFEPDQELLGEWVFQYYGYDIYKVNFGADGSIKLQFVQEGITYNGSYTIEDGQVNFTYYVGDSVAAPIEYSVDGDTLTFLGAKFVRPGSEATPDEEDAIIVPED